MKVNGMSGLVPSPIASMKFANWGSSALRMGIVSQ